MSAFTVDNILLNVAGPHFSLICTSFHHFLLARQFAYFFGSDHSLMYIYMFLDFLLLFWLVSSVRRGVEEGLQVHYSSNLDFQETD